MKARGAEEGRAFGQTVGAQLLTIVTKGRLPLGSAAQCCEGRSWSTNVMLGGVGRQKR